MMNKGTKSNKLTTVKTRKEEYVASQPKTFLRRCLNKWWKYSVQLFNKNYFEIVEQICGTGPIQIRNPSHSSRWSFDKSNWEGLGQQ